VGIALDLSKALPHDDLAERALLGAMLTNNTYVNQVFSDLTIDDFYVDAHRLISSAIHQMVNDGQAADLITTSSILEKRNELKFVGGHSYLSSLIDDIPENLDISSYSRIVKDRSTLRKIILTSMGIIQRGSEPTAETDSLLNEMQEELIKISEHRIKRGFFSSQELVPPTLDLVEKIQKHGESEGLKTDFYELDDMTSGFQPGDLVVIAARPSMGKTALALNIAANMAIKSKKSVAFFSIEMSRTQIMMRLLSVLSQVSMSAIRTGKPHLSQKEWHEIQLQAAELENAKLYIDDSPSLSIIEMKSRSRRLMMERKLDIVFVDYLQLIKTTGEQLRRNDSRAQEIAIISASLKELAKELHIPVVALAQLNRSPETRGTRKDKGPKYLLSDLKESGAIEQDADVVIFLHREDQVDKDTDKKGIADVIIAKQRNGPTGIISLAFADKYTKFGNLEFGKYDAEE